MDQCHQTANWQKKQEKISREHYDKVYVLLEDLRKDIMVRNVSFNPRRELVHGLNFKFQIEML